MSFVDFYYPIKLLYLLRIYEENCIQMLNKYDEKKISKCEEFLDNIVGKNDKK